MSKIKTTHVGSLPRSNELSDLLFKKDQKENLKRLVINFYFFSNIGSFKFFVK